MARRSTILVSRTLYQIGTLTLIVALIWLGVGIYAALSKPVNIDVDKKIMDPINPVLDLEVIKQLSQRLSVNVEIPTNASQSGSIDSQGIQP